MNTGRRVIIEVRFRATAQHRAILEPGATLQVGQREPAQLIVASDPHLSAQHFEVTWDGTTCILRDQSGARGTLAEGRRVTEARLLNGSWIRAGTTDFSVYFEDDPPQAIPLATPNGPLVARQILARFQEESLPLFAVADAARSERICALLQHSVEPSRSLYEGLQGERLAQVAPYLVSFPCTSPLLRSFIMEGWGANWAIYFSCAQPLAEVRRHLRKLMMIEGPTGQRLYFRFYDPRVLLPFLRTSSAATAKEVFGPIECFWLEGTHPGQLVRLRYTPDGVQEITPSPPTSQHEDAS